MPKEADLIAAGIKEHKHTGVLSEKIQKSNHQGIIALEEGSISFHNELSGAFTITLYTLAGKQIHKQSVSLAGSNSVTLTSTPLSSGVYLVSVEGPSISFYTKQIVE